MSVRVLVCGGRDYADKTKIIQVLAKIYKDNQGIDVLIDGGATGADRMAHESAVRNGIPTMTFGADWKLHGNAAGPIRNATMLREGKPNLVVAFPGGRGTADMVAKARAAGVTVLEVEA